MMPKAIGQERVVRGIGAERHTGSDHQKQPPDRVARLAPRDQHPDPRARNADHQRHEPVEQLMCQQCQRDRGHEGQRSQASQEDYPGRR